MSVTKYNLATEKRSLDLSERAKASRREAQKIWRKNTAPEDVASNNNVFSVLPAGSSCCWNFAGFRHADASKDDLLYFDGLAFSAGCS